MSDALVQVLLPVHNEATSIERTIREIHDELSPKVPMEFIVCEDGSTDGTQEVLASLRAQMPMKLLASTERKGYAQAIIGGFREVRAPWVLVLDSDGQCDPKDFWAFWSLRDRYDVLLGWRVKRADPWFRRWMSAAFRWLYMRFFDVPVHDPSCPYLLINKRVLDLLTPELGRLPQGLWWEFVARAQGHQFTIAEVPVAHRRRVAGATRVFRPWKIPAIAFRSIRGLLQLRRETAGGKADHGPGAA